MKVVIFMVKLRIYWIPQVPCKPFYVPIQSIKEGLKIITILSTYDAFQFENNIRPDYCNAGGVQMYDEKTKEWIDWEEEKDGIIYSNENIFDYLSQEYDKKEMEEFSSKMYGQININELLKIR